MAIKLFNGGDKVRMTLSLEIEVGPKFESGGSGDWASENIQAEALRQVLAKLSDPYDAPTVGVLSLSLDAVTVIQASECGCLRTGDQPCLCGTTTNAVE